MNHQFLTVDDLADKLQVKKSWVYGKTRETGPNSIPRIRCGKYLRFEIHAVMDWLKRQNEAE